jgi:hypothetical protein
MVKLDTLKRFTDTAMLLAFSVGFVACTTGNDVPHCLPGASVACICSDGRSGAQLCLESGAGLGACSCTSTDDAGSPDDGGLPMDAFAAVDMMANDDGTLPDTGMTCPNGTHACSGVCVSNHALESCGESCDTCATDPHGTASCDGLSCQLDCGRDYILRAGACASLAALVQHAYLKASNTEPVDFFAAVLALSADGTTLAIGGGLEDSAATGIGGDQSSNAATDSGAVYIFRLVGDAWTQEAYLKASNTEAQDRFGDSGIGLSADGNTLVVMAAESSSATGVNGDQSDNSALYSGAAYVFHRSAGAWAQEAYLKASNTEGSDAFIMAAISDDGNTIAIGAPNEASIATGINGNQADNSAMYAGAVYVFRRTGTEWAQEAYVKASNTDAWDSFGWSVALSGNGDVLVVGAPGEASAGRGLAADQSDDSFSEVGAVYVFARVGSTWSQVLYAKASNAERNDRFGNTVDVSADGRVFAASAIREASLGTGVDADQTDNSGDLAGAVYVFRVGAIHWEQDAYVKASNTDAGDFFGIALALSADGRTLVVGTPSEASHARGIGGDQADDSALGSGALYVFRYFDDLWFQDAYVKASNADPEDGFAIAVGVSADGTTIVSAASEEDSASIGVGGAEDDNSASYSGAAYAFGL